MMNVRNWIGVLLALAVMLTCVLGMTGCNKDDETETTTAESTTATTAETTKEETTKAIYSSVAGFDIAAYEGNWTEQDAETGVGNVDHVGSSLTISDVDGAAANVTIYNYKATIVDNHTITVENNQAELKTEDLTLTLTFGDDFISVVVVNSNDDTVPVGTKDVYVK